MFAEECQRIENLRHDTPRIEERDALQINTVKQKQHKENIARKINPYNGLEQIHYYIINVHLEGKNALIVVKKVTSIRIAESQKTRGVTNEKYS